MSTEIHDHFPQEMQRGMESGCENSEETNFRDLAFGPEEGDCIETARNLQRTPARSSFITLRTTRRARISYQMLLIEQGAMQMKRSVVEEDAVGSAQKVDEGTRCQCLCGVGVYQDENKLRVLLKTQNRTDLSAIKLDAKVHSRKK